jgi:DNA (cytosine-5)-methyltransferase 1
MHKGPRGTEAVESGHVVTVGTLRAHHPGTAGTQSDTDHIVATYPINTQLGLRGPDVSNTSRDGLGVGDETDPAYTLQAGHSHAVAFDTTQITSPHNYSNPQPGDPCHPLAAGAHPPAVAFSAKDYGADATEELSPTLRAGGFTNSHQNGGVMPAVAFQPTADCLTAAYGTKWNGNASATNGSLFAQQQSTVRRLTPVECERLQGFPDNFTAIPWRKKGAEDCPDGPRYKALGNSMAVPVMRWIGERIRLIDDYISII